MANKVVSTGRIELVDLNDSKQLQLYISSSQPKTQIFNTDNNTYLPNWTTNKPILTPQLFVAGSSVNVIDKAKSIKWYEDGSINPIVSGSNYTLGAGSKTLTINNNILASADMKIFTCEIIYTDEGTGFDIQIKSGIDYVKIVSGKKGDKGETGDGAVVAVLSNDYHGIATDSSGAGGSYTQATSKLHIFIGGTDTSGSWTITATPSSGVTGSLSGQTYSVANMTVDTGTVTFLAKRSGFADISKVFRVAKSKSGTKGDTGDTGNNAVSYWLIGSSETLIRSAGGVYTPNGFTVTGKVKIGSANPTEYASIWLISESTDGNTYIDKFKSGIPEVSKTYNPQINLHSIRIRMYLADGITLVDEQIVSVAHQGDKGEDGRGAVNTVAWTPDGNTIKNGDRSIKAQLSLYEGSEVTQADNYRWYRENPTKSSAVAGDGWEDLDIGRENIYEKSGSPYIGNYAYTPNKTIIEGRECLSFTDTNNIIAVNPLSKSLEVGEEYTFSFYAKASNNIILSSVYMNPVNSGFIPNTTISTVWERYSFSFVVKDSGDNVRTHMYPVVKNPDGTYETFYLANWKLEKGNSATAWTPSSSEKLVEDEIMYKRNYLQQSDRTITSGSSSFPVTNSLINFLNNNNSITLSVDIDVEKVTGMMGNRRRIGMEMSVVYEDDTTTYFGAWKHMEDGESYKGRFSNTYNVTKKVKSIVVVAIYIQLTAEKVSVSRPKVESGVNVTGWIPSPEDNNPLHPTVENYNNSWVFQTYANPKTSTNYIVDYSILEGLTPKTKSIITDSSTLIKPHVGEIGYLKTAVYVSQDKEILIGNPYNGNTITYINSVSIYSQVGWSENGMKVKLKAGWNTIEFMWVERSATDYWDISPTILSQVDEMNGYFALDFGALRGIDGIEGFNTDVMMVSPDAVTNVESFKCIVEYESRIYSDVVIVNDSTDPYGIVLLGTTTFKNGEGESTFTAKLYQDGLEVDENNDSGYTYRWYIYNSDDSKHSTWNTVGYKEGKTITVNADDITNEGRLVCEVDY